jgi:hypothetical protein
MINEYGAVGGIRIGKGNLPQCHFVHHNFHIKDTYTGFLFRKVS